MLSVSSVSPNREPDTHMVLHSWVLKWWQWSTSDGTGVWGSDLTLSSWLWLRGAVWLWWPHSPLLPPPNHPKWEVSDLLSSRADSNTQSPEWTQKALFPSWRPIRWSSSLSDLIGLFASCYRSYFGCLATQWWRLPIPRGAINEWADIHSGTSGHSQSNASQTS